MGPVTSTDRPGLVAVDKYLLPNEVQVATVRRHPAVLIGPSVMALVGLLAAGVLSATVASSSHVALYIIWGIELILVLRLLWKAWNWAVDYFVVTSARLLQTAGVFTRSVAMVPLSKITDLTFERTFSGRMLGYGDLRIESAGQRQALERVDHIPYPEHLYLLVCGMLFPESLEPVQAEDQEPGFGVDDNPLPPDEGDFPEDDGPPPDEYDGPDDGYQSPDGYSDDPASTRHIRPVIIEDDAAGLPWMKRRRRPIAMRRIRRSRGPNDEL